jgi:hypothetical protein
MANSIFLATVARQYFLNGGSALILPISINHWRRCGTDEMCVRYDTQVQSQNTINRVLNKVAHPDPRLHRGIKCLI